jgi:hypothetical protein
VARIGPGIDPACRYRLVLHGLASEMLYEFLVRAKRTHTAATA